MPSEAVELMLFEVARVESGPPVVKRAVRDCSVRKAATLLECSTSTVRRLYGAGLIKGWQPSLALSQSEGKRRAGSKKPNCKIVLDWDSVMEYRETEKRAQELAKELF